MPFRIPGKENTLESLQRKKYYGPRNKRHTRGKIVNGVRVVPKVKYHNKDGTLRKPLTARQKAILAAGRKKLAEKVIARATGKLHFA